MIDKRLKRMSVSNPKKKDRVFKYTSNKEQFEFNEQILAELEDVKLRGRAKRSV